MLACRALTNFKSERGLRSTGCFTIGRVERIGIKKHRFTNGVFQARGKTNIEHELVHSDSLIFLLRLINLLLQLAYL